MPATLAKVSLNYCWGFDGHFFCGAIASMLTIGRVGAAMRKRTA
jgi:hypothetical protein